MKLDYEYTAFIKRVKLSGYKSIENIEVEFDPKINIIIGKNSSGKSNFVSFLYTVLTYRGMNLPFLSGEIEMINTKGVSFKWHVEKSRSRYINIQNQNFDPERDLPIPLEKLFVGKKKVYDSSKLKDEMIKLNGGGSINRRYMDPVPFLFTDYKTFPPFTSFIKYNLPLDLIFLETSGRIEATKSDKKNFGTIGFTSFGLFTYQMRYLQNALMFEGDPNKINKTLILNHLTFNEEVKKKIGKYSPIQDFRFSSNLNIYQDEKTLKIENLYIEFKINNTWMHWNNLSDGTRRLFYLLFEISKRDNGIFFIEEPELGIHPHQFHLIMIFLKAESETKQIFITTHSPQALDVLDELELSKILITNYYKDKGTKVVHLSKSQIEKAKKYMKQVGFLSDYWRLSDLES